MKKLILAAVLLLIAVGVCVCENRIIEDYCRTAQVYIENMKTDFKNENYSEAKNSAEKLENLWNETEDKLVHITNSENLDSIGETVARLPNLAGEECDEFMSETRAFEVMLEHLRDSEKYYIY